MIDIYSIAWPAGFLGSGFRSVRVRLPCSRRTSFFVGCRPRDSPA